MRVSWEGRLIICATLGVSAPALRTAPQNETWSWQQLPEQHHLTQTCLQGSSRQHRTRHDLPYEYQTIHHWLKHPWVWKAVPVNESQNGFLLWFSLKRDAFAAFLGHHKDCPCSQNDGPRNSQQALQAIWYWYLKNALKIKVLLITFVSVSTFLMSLN